ncbi:MAG: hypothetical protein EOP04_30630 [Proteobacteria bacterium]|nr:MAG: hypothetical protein EOP04_30630 [Pseudomonadota bacterium]
MFSYSGRKRIKISSPVQTSKPTKRKLNEIRIVPPQDLPIFTWIESGERYDLGMIFLWAFLLSIPSSFAAEKIKADHVEVSLIAPKSFAAKSEHIAVHFKPQKDWHIYWKNPGDSGAAPKFTLKSDSATFGEVQWPAPTRIPVGPMVNLGYNGDVVYPIELTPKHDDSVSGKIKLEWLVCKEECVPGFGEIQLTQFNFL